MKFTCDIPVVIYDTMMVTFEIDESTLTPPQQAILSLLSTDRDRTLTSFELTCIKNLLTNVVPEFYEAVDDKLSERSCPFEWFASDNSGDYAICVESFQEVV